MVVAPSKEEDVGLRVLCSLSLPIECRELCRCAYLPVVHADPIKPQRG